MAFVVWYGLYIWHKHRTIFMRFDGGDLWAAMSVRGSKNKHDRENEWIARNFILISASIALAMIDFCLRLNWAIHSEWKQVGTNWAYAWLLFHTAIGMFFIKTQLVASAALKSIADWNGMPDEQ